MTDYTFDASYAKQYGFVCGTDEAGRGPLAGSVVAAACILPEGLEIPELNDSKKLTPKKRDKLFDLICEKAIAYGIAEGTVEEINELNILEADLLAMRRAIDGLHTLPLLTASNSTCPPPILIGAYQSSSTPSFSSFSYEQGPAGSDSGGPLCCP